MPKRQDINKILVIGSGPIVIGQACEFDYSGTQACKALKEEGYSVVLINSNPATIMTDPDLADKTYVEPINEKYIKEIIIKEKPDALLATMGGQTSLNMAVSLSKDGFLENHNVELIGAKLEAIELAEDREKFKDLMQKIGLKTPRSQIATNLDQALNIARSIGYPIIVRPAFTLGGYGGGIAYNQDELQEIVIKGLHASPTQQLLIEQSVLGWKEIEFEVMRDINDNCVIICAIENFDPMGIHTGDSITVAPCQTLTDKEFQALRNAAIKVIRAVGVETGGSNVQFALNPENGEIMVIEMNPRVSRSSALASKATGFPIAKIAAKLAVGYTLDEIPNDITKTTMACFEPSLDYVVCKIPRFAFEKFPESKDELNTQMKAVGETMALGRSFKESFQKALRSLEYKSSMGFIDKDIIKQSKNLSLEEKQELKASLLRKISFPSSQRLYQIFSAFFLDASIEEIHEETKIDKWFLAHLSELVIESKSLLARIQVIKKTDHLLKELFSKEQLKELKEKGFSDKQICFLINTEFELKETELRKFRQDLGLRPVYKTIDTCAGEFESYTPYHYSSYDLEDETQASDKEVIIILGGGPNRIGQGIEFDYCCVQAAQVLSKAGYETIMINNNPETVSTDFDTSDKLYFEPITVEDVLEIYHCEKSKGAKIKGVIVQLGGQTPLNICDSLEAHGLNIIGTLPEKIHLAEDRDEFGKILEELKLKQAQNAIAYSIRETKTKAQEIGYPVVIRPSYVLGGRGMEIVKSETQLNDWLSRVLLNDSQYPILIDKFLDSAIEVDVDAIADGKECVIAGIMEHVEYAGIHSGDSACVYPCQNLSKKLIQEIKIATSKLALRLEVKGLMNIQFAIKDEELYILEVNPRASRSVPFISKANGVPWAQLAALIMAGQMISDFKEIIASRKTNQVSVKEAVFSFNKFAGCSVFLGPEMKSTGEVMGISDNFAHAFAKAQIGAGFDLEKPQRIFFNFNPSDIKSSAGLAEEFIKSSYILILTKALAKRLEEDYQLKVEKTNEIKEGRPNIEDLLRNGEIDLIINMEAEFEDNKIISKIAQEKNIPIVTTLTGAKATLAALNSLKNGKLQVKALQDLGNKAPLFISKKITTRTMSLNPKDTLSSL